MTLPLTRIPEGDFTSFIRAPVCEDVTALEADVAILGVAHAIPYPNESAQTYVAPQCLRDTSMRFRHSLGAGHNFDFGGELLDGRDVRVVDCGDVPADPADHPGNSARATHAVRTILERGAVPIVFGGTDAVPIPVIRAYEGRGPIVVVQVDQHLDFKDEVMGVREGYSSPMRRASEMPWVDRIVQIGLHGIGRSGTPEVADALVAGNLLVTEREVHEQGMIAILEQIPAGADYFITIDFDGLDPAVCPAVSDPEPGGLTYTEAVDLLRGLAARGRVVGMDMVEFVPEHDLHGLGARTAGRLVLNLINAMTRAGRFDK